MTRNGTETRKGQDRGTGLGAKHDGPVAATSGDAPSTQGNNSPNPTPSVTEELKPCPFCGKPPLIVCPDDSYGSAMITCGDANECPVDLTAWGDLKSGETIEDAKRAWNTRPQQTGLTDVERALLSAGVTGADLRRKAALAVIAAMQQPVCADVERQVDALIEAARIEEASKRLGIQDQMFATKKLNEARAALLVSNRSGVERLREALKPFAHYADINDIGERDPDNTIEVPVRDLLEARAALDIPTIDKGRND